MNCKACGKEITSYRPVQLGDFCSENCFWSFTDAVETLDYLAESLPVKSVKEKKKTNTEIHWDLIKNKIKKNGQFRISNKTLQPYLTLHSWGEFLLFNGLMVVRSDDEYSVIKRSIL